MNDQPDFASRTLTRHLVKGTVGIGALVAAFAFIPVTGPLSLALAPAGLVVLRGCPMCWVIGLTQTISRGRLQRSCADGKCTLTVADPSETGTEDRSGRPVVSRGAGSTAAPPDPAA